MAHVRILLSLVSHLLRKIKCPKMLTTSPGFTWDLWDLTQVLMLEHSSIPQQRRLLVMLIN